MSIFFGKKKPADLVKEDRELVEKNAKFVDTLIVLTKGNGEAEGMLKSLQEQLKYLIPTADPKVYNADKQIGNKLGDLRIILTKADGESTRKVQEEIQAIRIVIADRNVKL